MDDAPRTSTLLKLAVGAALLMPIAALIIAVAFREWVMFPGALVSSVMYGVLGYFAVRGRDWARWILFAFMVGTALLGLLLTFVRLGGGSPTVGFNPWVAVIPLSYGLIAVGLALRPHRVAG